MNRRLLTIILAVALIASFFLPISSAGSGSAFNVVKGPSYGSGIESMLMKYLWILIPLSGVMLLIGALNNGHYLLGRGLWAVLPLLALLYLLGRPMIETKMDIGAMVKGFGIGLWVAVVASLISAIYHPKA